MRTITLRNSPLNIRDMKQLLSLNFFKFSEKDIYKIKSKVPTSEHLFRRLPEYCLTSTGITRSEEYLQFVGLNEDMSSSEPRYIMFDINYASSYLEEELSNSGVEWLFKQYNIKLNYKSLVTGYKMNTPSDIMKEETLLVFDIDYSDEDLFLKLIGYLDDNMTLVDTFDILMMNEGINNKK